MPRVQLAINVSDLEKAVEFYSTLFGSNPHKVRPGYANFALSDPPLKLVLMEGGEPGTINHLGVEVETSSRVKDETSRLEHAGLETLKEERTLCCYAVQEKVWVNDPDGSPWEIYTILDDEPSLPLAEGTCECSCDGEGCPCACC